MNFSRLNCSDDSVVLALAPPERKDALKDLRTWLAKVDALAGRPAVYVTEALASYERRWLIEQKVPFIVPGNALSGEDDPFTVSGRCTLPQKQFQFFI